MLKKNYVYFVSYLGRKKDGGVFVGRSEVEITEPIEGCRQIEAIEENIKEKFGYEKSVTTINFILLRVEEQADE